MSQLDDLLALVPLRDGVEGIQRKYVDFIGPGWNLTDNAALQRAEWRLDGMGTTRARVATAAAMPANTRTGNSFQANANGVLAAVDGVTLVVGDVFLDKNHATAANRGLMVVVSVGSAGTPAQWSRVSSADSDLEVRTGMGMVFVEEGTANADRLFALTTNGTITLNTTGLAWSAVSGPPLAAGAGDDGKIFYASGGVPVLSAAELRINSTGTSLLLGSNSASETAAGQILTSNGFGLRSKTFAGTSVILFSFSSADRLDIGGTGVGRMVANVGAANDFVVSHNGVFSTTFTATAVTLPLGGTAATAGSLRVAHGFNLLGRDFANAANCNVIAFGSAGNDRIDIGGTNVASIVSNVATGNTHTWRVNSVDAVSITSTGLRLHFGGTVATAGDIRLITNATVQWRDAGNTNNMVGIQYAAQTLVLGQSTINDGTIYHIGSGIHDFRVAGTTEYTFSASVADFKDNELRFGTNPATGAKINTPTNVTILRARNAANTLNANVLDWSSGDLLTVGDAVAVNGIVYNTKTGTPHTFQINSVTEYAFSATAFDLLQNTLTGVNIIEIGTAPFATLGVFRVPHAITLIVGRNQANSGNINLVRFGSGANDRLTLGDSGGGATQIASTSIGLYNVTPVAQAADMVAITDSTGGVVSTTFAAITAGAGYTQADMTAVKNALASSAAQINKVRTALRNIGIMA
jgi:hypothetical protein